MPRPDLKTFLTDPKHEEERTFFNGLINNAVDQRVAAAKEARKKKGGGEDKNLWDSLFGPDDNEE